MANEIQKYTPKIWVKSQFGDEVEFLYWEWTMKEFADKLATSEFMYFNLHKKAVAVQKIKEFWEIRDVVEYHTTPEIRPLTLSERKKVIETAKKIRANLIKKGIFKWIKEIYEKNKK